MISHKLKLFIGLVLLISLFSCSSSQEELTPATFDKKPPPEPGEYPSTESYKKDDSVIAVTFDQWHEVN